MKNINIKSIAIGYLTYFVPSFILTFLGIQIGVVNFSFLALGGYITAKLNPGQELKHSLTLGGTAFALSVLLASIIFAAAGQNYKFSKLLYDICFALFFCLSAPALGGLLRRIQLQKIIAKSN